MTIDEFAKSVGVSTATVSRTLSGRGPVSPQTRSRILRQMEALGYVPNLSARSLVTGRTNTVLLACGEIPAVGDLFTLEMIRGIQRALADHRYGLLLNAPDTGVLGAVIGRAVDGVLLMDDDDTAPDPGVLARKITSQGIPCVIIGHRPMEPHPKLGSVIIDVEDSAEAVARLLTSHGHRNIGFIGSRFPDKLLERFRATLANIGLALPESQVVIAGIGPQEGRRGLHDLLDRRHPSQLTAVFARTDSLAAGALQAARERGLRVPGDISIVGHDDSPLSALMAPPLTTMQVDCGLVGAAAAEMLLSFFADGEASPPSRVFRPHPVIRDTVGPPPKQVQKD